MNNQTRHFTVLLLLACLLAQAVFPVTVRAYANMTASDAAIELIRSYEGFSAEMYEKDGHWYVGYGSQVEEDAYPDGVTEEEAAELVRKELSSVEKSLNNFFSSNRLSPTQGQFDALTDFTYIHGSAWMSGSSALVRIARGDTQASRRETARAFGVWSHSNGKVLPGLARRHLEEAALYLDGNTDKKDEFAFLSIEKRDGVIYSSDFAVYERGGVYDAFPTMFLLGYTLTGARTEDGRVIHIGDTVTDGCATTPVWEKNVYTSSYDDVQSGAWFYDYVMELSEGGVVNGRGNGVFDPEASVTVGEALKLILLAAGKEEQSPTGAHWASGYAELARSNDYLAEQTLADLEQPIKRADVARLAAKAIGFGQSFASTPFVDTKNGYAAALAEINVLNGIVENGESHFYPNKLLTRAEISTIVWRLRNQVALGVSQTVRYGSHDYKVNAELALNDYDPDYFSGKGVTMTYNEPGVTVLRGVDVSRWQEDIDWEKVAADGVQFAILRAGARYQTSGELFTDRKFEEYYAGASAVGIKLGYYIYSQAVNTDEAVEEADYILSLLKGKRVDGPVVFDWETAGSDNPNARSNNVPVSVVCDCAVAFCERIKAAGYSPMIYMNTHDAYIKYDLSRLQDYPIWYAGQYNGAYPKFVYDFDIWQYTSSGKVDGISGGADMDLWFFP